MSPACHHMSLTSFDSRLVIYKFTWWTRMKMLKGGGGERETSTGSFILCSSLSARARLVCCFHGFIVEAQQMFQASIDTRFLPDQPSLTLSRCTHSTAYLRNWGWQSVIASIPGHWHLVSGYLQFMQVHKVFFIKFAWIV